MCWNLQIPVISSLHFECLLHVLWCCTVMPSQGNRSHTIKELLQILGLEKTPKSQMSCIMCKILFCVSYLSNCSVYLDSKIIYLLEAIYVYPQFNTILTCPDLMFGMKLLRIELPACEKLFIIPTIGFLLVTNTQQKEYFASIKTFEEILNVVGWALTMCKIP